MENPLRGQCGYCYVTYRAGAEPAAIGCCSRCLRLASRLPIGENFRNAVRRDMSSTQGIIARVTIALSARRPPTEQTTERTTEREVFSGFGPDAA